MIEVNSKCLEFEFDKNDCITMYYYKHKIPEENIYGDQSGEIDILV